MAAKVNWNFNTFEVEVTLAPDVNGFIDLDVQVDLYSDAKEDWVSTPGLRRLDFGMLASGGFDTGSGVQGTIYFLLDPWKIRLYGADHELRLDGVLRTLDGSRFWLPPVVPRSVAVTQLSPSDVAFLEPEEGAGGSGGPGVIRMG